MWRAVRSSQIVRPRQFYYHAVVTHIAAPLVSKFPDKFASGIVRQLRHVQQPVVKCPFNHIHRPE
ncbi:MAG: hypothetical protein E5V71_00035 [Mesorhizobium sp.]|nr:MAG: hypothetical protein E5V71_00035 [Mesorhizobium sp.]